MHTQNMILTYPTKSPINILIDDQDTKWFLDKQ